MENPAHDGWANVPLFPGPLVVSGIFSIVGLQEKQYNKAWCIYRDKLFIGAKQLIYSNKKCFNIRRRYFR